MKLPVERSLPLIDPGSQGQPTLVLEPLFTAVPRKGVNRGAQASMKRQHQGMCTGRGSSQFLSPEKLANSYAPPARGRPGYSTRAAHFSTQEVARDLSTGPLSFLAELSEPKVGLVLGD